jgi:hypothetical protein
MLLEKWRSESILTKENNRLNRAIRGAFSTWNDSKAFMYENKNRENVKYMISISKA